MRTSGKSYYHTSDAQGSVIALTDSTQALAAAYTYDPWGNTTSTGSLAATNPWTYATGYTDAATGYLKLGARYYNPTTGRFTQPDPAALYGGYAYADDNPTNFTDPTGLFTSGQITGGIVAGMVGFAAGGLFCIGTGGLGCAVLAGVGVGAVAGAWGGAVAAGIDGTDRREGIQDGAVLGGLGGMFGGLTPK